MNTGGQISSLSSTPGILDCLWMDAGVVDFKLCDREYDCEHCPFDQGLHSGAEKRPFNNPQLDVQGCKLASDVFYHPGHTWARVEGGGVVRIGLDDFAQRLLGTAYALTLPLPNTQIKKGEAPTYFTHQSGVAVLFPPVSGKVKQTNASVLLRPTLINRDPYCNGWMMLVEPYDLKSCLKGLMYGERVRDWIKEEINKLRMVIDNILNSEQMAASTMTDGGLLTQQFLSGLSVEQTRRVISSFFASPQSDEAKHTAILIPDRR